MPVTSCSTELSNQCKGKKRVGICAGTSALYGRRAEVSLTDYFLVRRVTDVQSGFKPQQIQKSVCIQTFQVPKLNSINVLKCCSMWTLYLLEWSCILALTRLCLARKKIAHFQIRLYSFNPSQTFQTRDTDLYHAYIHACTVTEIRDMHTLVNTIKSLHL